VASRRTQSTVGIAESASLVLHHGVSSSSTGSLLTHQHSTFDLPLLTSLTEQTSTSTQIPGSRQGLFPRKSDLCCRCSRAVCRSHWSVPIDCALGLVEEKIRPARRVPTRLLHGCDHSASL
ncbi:unnamed protein product, partial [Callosobruchus maculatus]